jgi:hypothetical protein
MNTRSHPKKLTVQLINDRLSERGLEIIGRYINAHTKSEFRCQYQHEWLALPMNVLAGKGCPHCANRAKLTPEFINDRLREREITMIGKYYNTHTLTLFNCIHKHEWLATPTNVLRGSGCPECAGNKLSTEEFVKTKLPSSISMIGQYINARTKIKLFVVKAAHLAPNMDSTHASLDIFTYLSLNDSLRWASPMILTVDYENTRDTTVFTRWLLRDYLKTDRPHSTSNDTSRL